MTEETIFQEALARSPADRAPFLEQACAGRPDLLAAVEQLLAAHEKSGNLLDRPPVGLPQTVDSDPGAAKHGATGEYMPKPEGAPSHLGTSDFRQLVEPGLVIGGRYTLQQKIGEGGMGEVWVAKQSEPVKRKVALKLIKTGMDSKAVLTRFEQERQALALMDHPNIARVLDGGMTPTGQPFFVMELVNGLALNKFCDEMKLTPRERLELFGPICQAVQHAHQKGIVHRDLKPANILITMVDGKPVPKVIDFGVAKATAGKLTDDSMSTQFGAVVGTLEYMSPEQAGFSGEDVDTRADIYSLGVILYESLTGLKPIDAKRLRKAALTEMIRILREEEPSKPSTRLSSDESLPSLAALRQTQPKKLMALLRGELDWVVMKCLEKDRTRRYETANSLARDIQRYLADEMVEARPPSAGYRLQKFVKRNKGQVIAASLLLVALLAGITGTTIGLFEARKQEQRATDAAAEERKAKAREAERAEGEKAAKLDAQQKERLAVAAADQERQAKEEAIRNLAFAKKGNEILGSVFAGLEPKKIAESGRPLQDVLRENLVNAVKELEGAAIGDLLEVAAMQDTLGRSLGGLGDYVLAVEVLQKALDTRTARLGADNPDTLLSMNNLAMAHKEAGKLDLALPLFEETLKLHKARLGPKHPHTLTIMANLAAAYQEAKKQALALPLLEETLKLRKATLGPEHHHTLISMNNLALAYRVAGKLDLALPLFEETLKLHKARHGPEHPHTLTTMANLASAYLATGKWDLALPLLEETLKLKRTRLGPDHPDTLISMNNLAMAYQGAGKLALALPLLEETLKLKIARLGLEHPNTLTTMANLGIAYCDAKQGGNAAATLKEFIAGTRKRSQPGDPRFAGLLASVSLELSKCGQHAVAEEMLRECLAIRDKTQPDVWTTFNTQSLLGGALLGQKKYADAEPLLLAGYEGLKQREKTIPPKDKICISEAIERLVQHYQATEKKDEAAKWRKTLEGQAGKVIGPVHEVGKGLELRGQLDKQTSSLVYQVKLSGNKSYVIDMVSPDQKALDPYLVLTDATGKKLAEDDDSGGGLNARITFRADQDGTYRIQATSFNQGVGAFTLTVREEANPPIARPNQK